MIPKRKDINPKDSQRFIEKLRELHNREVSGEELTHYDYSRYMQPVFSIYAFEYERHEGQYCLKTMSFILESFSISAKGHRIILSLLKRYFKIK